MGLGPALSQSEATIPLAKFQMPKPKIQTNPKVQMSIEIQMPRLPARRKTSAGEPSLGGQVKCQN